jgi:DNA modification methylase
VWYSRPGARDRLKKLHPATFAEKDIERLICTFTKKGGRVLDPFLGSGSTLLACAATGRTGMGIELSAHWADIAAERLGNITSSPKMDILTGDARDVLPNLQAGSFDFVVTSPPYFSILEKAKDHKSKAERRGLATKYSVDPLDLGNLSGYGDFLGELGKVWRECHRILKPGKYICVVVTDFRDGPRYVMFHADVARTLEDAGFVPKGIVVLVQDNKALYPYGYPYSFVPNIHHQNVLIFRKDVY